MGYSNILSLQETSFNVAVVINSMNSILERKALIFDKKTETQLFRLKIYFRKKIIRIIRLV